MRAQVFCILLLTVAGCAEEDPVRILTREVTDGAPDQRQVAATKLGEMGEVSAPAVPALINAVRAYIVYKEQHSDELAREDIGRNQEVRGYFRGLLRLRAASVKALGLIGPSAHDALPILADEMTTSHGDLEGEAIKRIAPSLSKSVNEFLSVKEILIVASAQDFFWIDKKEKGQTPTFSPSLGGPNGFLTGSTVHEMAEGVPGKAKPLNGYLFRVLSLDAKQMSVSLATGKSDMTRCYGLVAYPDTYGTSGRNVYVLLKSVDSEHKVFRRDFASQIVVDDAWKSVIDSSWVLVSKDLVAKEVKLAVTSAPPPPPSSPPSAP